MTIVFFFLSTCVTPLFVFMYPLLKGVYHCDTDAICLSVNFKQTRTSRDVLLFVNHCVLRVNLCRCFCLQVASQRMQGVLLLVFSKCVHLPFLRGVQTQSTRTGLGGCWVRNEPRAAIEFTSLRNLPSRDCVRTFETSRLCKVPHASRCLRVWICQSVTFRTSVNVGVTPV